MTIYATILALGLLAPSSSPEIADRAAELGDVSWRRGVPEALAASRKTGRPLLLLFQEVPGCRTCIDYGQQVMSHPLVVEAAEDLFVPVVVYNNRGGDDAAALERFGEPAWNNPVLRFVDAGGKDLIPRRAGIYGLGETVRRMVASLEKADLEVPAYLRLLALEHSPDLEQATFAMACFWTGEARLGGLDGVAITRPAWRDGHEVVELRFDPALISYETLVRKALEQQCASRIFAHDAAQQAVAERLAPSRVDRVQGAAGDAKRSDQYYTLSRTAYRDAPMIDAQKTKVNAALALGSDPERYLSPRQHRHFTAKR